MAATDRYQEKGYIRNRKYRYLSVIHPSIFKDIVTCGTPVYEAINTTKEVQSYHILQLVEYSISPDAKSEQQRKCK